MTSGVDATDYKNERKAEGVPALRCDLAHTGNCRNQETYDQETYHTIWQDQPPKTYTAAAAASFPA